MNNIKSGLFIKEKQETKKVLHKRFSRNTELHRQGSFTMGNRQKDFL